MFDLPVNFPYSLIVISLTVIRYKSPFHSVSVKDPSLILESSSWIDPTLNYEAGFLF